MSSIKHSMHKGLNSVLDWIESQLLIGHDSSSRHFLISKLKQSLNEDSWNSVSHFYIEASKILDLTNGSSELKLGFENKVCETFPWFNMQTTSIFRDPICSKNSPLCPPPGQDHLYATQHWTEKTHHQQQRSLDDFFCKFERIYDLTCDDNRKCCFCTGLGEDGECGRLLPIRQGEYVHLNCALWSSEVIEAVGGGLVNVSSALCRSLKLSCSYCGLKGASAGCWVKGCSSNYHFHCGFQMGASYKKDKSVYCKKHKDKYSNKEDIDPSDLIVSRSLYVDSRAESRKKTKLVNLNNIRFQVGSLTVDNIGYLNLDVSDGSSSLIPLDLKCSRLYWSVKDPRRIVKYHCRTRLIKRKCKPEPSEPSFCFNHETQNESLSLKDSLSAFHRCLASYEMKKKNWGPGQILHPYAVSSEWKHISYRDLHSSPILPSDSQRPKRSIPECLVKRRLKRYLRVKKPRSDSSSKSSLLKNLKENHVPQGTLVLSAPERLNEIQPMKINHSCNVKNSISSENFTAKKSGLMTVHDMNYLSDILQVDGASDDVKFVCPKCRKGFGDWGVYEQHVSSCRESKRTSEGSYSEVRPPKSSKQDPQPEEVSPRRDFGIEGLLSPPEQQQLPQNVRTSCDDDSNPIIVDEVEDDDVVIISQTRNKSSKSSLGKKKMRKGNSAPTLRQPPVTFPPQPMPSSLYPPDLSSLSHPTLHCINPPPSYQVGSVLHHPYYNPQIPGFPPRPSPGQFSYVTPAGYIFNQNSFFPPQQAILFNQQTAYSQNILGYPFPPPVGHHPLQPTPSQHPPPASSSTITTKSKKKVARVQPQPVVVAPEASSSSHQPSSNMGLSAASSSMDPIKALSNMVPSRKNHHASATSTKEMSHHVVMSSGGHDGCNKLSLEQHITELDKQRVGAASNLLTGIEPKFCTRPGSVVSRHDHSRPSSSSSVSVIAEPISSYEDTLNGSTRFSYEHSDETSIKLVLKRKNSDESGGPYSVEEVSVQDACRKDINPKVATDLLKQLKTSKRKKRLAFVSIKEEEIINEVEANAASPLSPQLWRPHESKKLGYSDEGDYKVLYEITSEDGFKAVSLDANELWKQVFDAVQEARLDRSLAPIPHDAIKNAGLQMLGLTHSAMSFILEQMPEVSALGKYRAKHKKQETAPKVEIKENTTGCARTEVYKDRSPLDMFSWLASKHRKKPDLSPSSKCIEFETISTNRRATSLDLPMAMRFRHLAKNAKEAVGVFNSGIHGRGLYCKREIQEGEMVIEYAGEEIRAVLADKREKYYESRGIGCYMFRIDDNVVIDATLKGNAARFINHCCDPNCYSKIVDVIGKKHIIIFALRTILPGEELTYDYKFPIEDVKIPCTCGKKKCRKYMN